MTVELAKRLAEEAGMWVFPVDGAKKPLTPNGFKDASIDPEQIDAMWDEHPDALIGVYCGKSEIVVLDIDYKERDGVVVDGFESLEAAWVEIPASFAYDSTSGQGRHIVYQAPKGKVLNGVAGYRKMAGVDRRAGGSYVVWNSRDVPTELVDAPDWLCDEASLRTLQTFEGDLEDWYENLTPGAPNQLVKRAIARVRDDFTHSEMVSAQHEAVRLGAEGNPGVPELLEALEEAFLNRNPAYHVTPQEEWSYKFTESLVSGVQKYGALTELITKMPPYSLSIVPNSIRDSELTGGGQNTSGLTNLINRMIRETEDDARIASILWNAPATKEKAREWGVEFLYRRIAEARVSKAPIQENPAVEEELSTPDTPAEEEEPTRTGGLLSDSEREILKYFKRFDDEYLEFALSDGFANEKYTRAGAWAVAGMAFSFRAFIPRSSTDKMGLNTWIIVMGESGTGKSTAVRFRDSVMNKMFQNAEEDEKTHYNLGHDSSISGLHEALLQRDKQASFFGADEASGFFKSISQQGSWQSGTDDTLSRWYDGYVEPSQKVRLKELRGQSALTSLTMQMYATPDRLVDHLSREQFLSGFLARVNWVVGDPPVQTDDRFNLVQQVEVETFEETPESVYQLSAGLLHLVLKFEGEVTRPILSTEPALQRLGEAYKEMYKFAEGKANWDIIEPSVTRLAQAMQKIAALNALTRGAQEVELIDAVNAIAVVEEWYRNLFWVADRVSQGAFQRHVQKMELWLRGQDGKRATKTKLFHAFKNDIEKDSRELDMRITFMLESGMVLRKERSDGKTEILLNE